MSSIHLHKIKAKFISDILKEILIKLLNHFNRHSGDRGNFRKAKKDLQDKIAEKEMKEEVRVIEMRENLDFDDGIDWDYKL
jgi:hypothetical protein